MVAHVGDRAARMAGRLRRVVRPVGLVAATLTVAGPLAVGAAVATALPAAAAPAGSTSVPTSTSVVSVTPAPAAKPRADQASDLAWQLDPAHDGHQPRESFPTAPIQQWRVHLAGAVSYPLIAAGRVFVTVTRPHRRGAELVALRAASGVTLWKPIDLGGTKARATIAYGAGRVVAVSAAGRVDAIGAAKGKVIWSIHRLGPQSFSAPPVIERGIVYVTGTGSPGRIYAIDLGSGKILWTAALGGRAVSPPTLGSREVYVAASCGTTYDLRSRSGTLRWKRLVFCRSKVGGETPVLHAGRLYVGEGSGGRPAVLSARSGVQLGTFSSSTTPVFDGSLELTVTHHVLQAVRVSTGKLLWSRRAPARLVTPPIVVGDLVLDAASSGVVAAFGLRSGAEAWSVNAGMAIRFPSVQSVSSQLGGLGAGAGELLVPAGSWLVAFAPAVVGPGRAPLGVTASSSDGGSNGDSTPNSPPTSVPEAPAPILLAALALVVSGAFVLRASRRRENGTAPPDA